MDLESPKLAKPKRSRLGARGVPKAKTGCSTYKIRRKKCDEAKPACSQCVGTGRKCDFLSFAPQSPVVLQRDYAGECQTDHIWTCHKLYSIIPLRDFEVPYFEYFQHVCTNEFSLYFELDLWGIIVLQAACIEPCIQHAALAIGALSRSQYCPADAKDSPYQTESAIQYSIRQYNLAIKKLNSSLCTSPWSWELTILGSVIFIAIEVLLGHDNRVQMHWCSALAILKSFPTVGTRSISQAD